MGLGAGDRDKLIVIERATVTTDALGGEIETWTRLTAPWAAVRYGTNAERREAAQTQSSQSATFTVPANPVTQSVAVRDRIIFSGAVWNVHGAVPDTDGAHIIITATRA